MDGRTPLPTGGWPPRALGALCQWVGIERFAIIAIVTAIAPYANEKIPTILPEYLKTWLWTICAGW